MFNASCQPLLLGSETSQEPLLKAEGRNWRTGHYHWHQHCWPERSVLFYSTAIVFGRMAFQRYEILMVPFFHIKVIRELTFLKTKKSRVIALTCWSSRRCPKPFCGNKRHGLWDENEGEIIGQSTHTMNTLEVDLSKWMTCAKVRLVAQTLLRLGKPVKVIIPSLILLAYIWKQNCQPQFWALGLGMIEAIPLSTWSFRCMGKTGEQARSWIRALGKSLGFSRIFLWT